MDFLLRQYVQRLQNHQEMLLLIDDKPYNCDDFNVFDGMCMFIKTALLSPKILENFSTLNTIIINL